MLSDKSAVNSPISTFPNKFIKDQSAATALPSSNEVVGQIKKLPRACEGATAIEYALIAAAIAVAIAVLVYAIGTDVLTNMFQRLADMLAEAG
jgi:Flp pilus assembly pilin Flp